MAGFPKSKRQSIIDGYLAATGRNMFIAAEFVDWLREQPDHEAFPWFYGGKMGDDAHAAREFRISLVRKMISGLRITVTRQTMDAETRSIRVTTSEYPAYVSPAAGRGYGGGYVTFDPSDPHALAELRKQGADVLRGWLSRFGGAFEDRPDDLEVIRGLAASQDGEVGLIPARVAGE